MGCPDNKDFTEGHSCCGSVTPEHLTAGVKPQLGMNSTHSSALIDVNTQTAEVCGSRTGSVRVVPVTDQAAEHSHS